MLLRAAKRLSTGIRIELEAWTVARRLRGCSGYYFTDDYVSHHSKNWALLTAGFRGKPDVEVLEIGSDEGRSAVWFLENILTHPTARLTCIDMFSHPARNLCFDHNIRISGASVKVTKLCGASVHILPTLPRERFDLIYVDGSHQAVDVLMDAVAGWQLLKPGGILLFDDYLWDRPGEPETRPKLAIDLFLESFTDQYELLLQGYQVAVHKLDKHRQASC